MALHTNTENRMKMEEILIQKGLPILLESERCWIKPLSAEQLQQYLQRDALEKTLGLISRERKISDEVTKALEETLIPQAIYAGKELPYITFWTIIDKEKKIMVGDICFKGKPNERGEVEIGYGTYPDFMGKGIMTEALSVLCHWAFNQPDVLFILAETDKENQASQKVLLKNNFKAFKQVENNTWWCLQKV